MSEKLPVDYELSQSAQFRAHLQTRAFTSSSRRLRAAPRLLRAKLRARAQRAAPHHLLAVTSYRPLASSNPSPGRAHDPPWGIWSRTVLTSRTTEEHLAKQ